MGTFENAGQWYIGLVRCWGTGCLSSRWAKAPLSQAEELKLARRCNYQSWHRTPSACVVRAPRFVVHIARGYTVMACHCDLIQEGTLRPHEGCVASSH